MKHNVERIVEYSKTFLRQCKLYHFHDTSSASGFKSFQDMGKNKFLDSFATNPVEKVKLILISSVVFLPKYRNRSAPPFCLI
jgi:predicted ATPase